MYSSRVNRIEQKPSYILPTTKLKNISCAFCRHEFFIRDLSHLRGAHLPLLLSCGHAACNQCIKIHADDSCPLCNDSPGTLDNSQDNSLLPVNIYVTGLIGISSTRPVHGDEADISFSLSLNTRIKERSIKNGHCSRCGKEAVVRCLQCSAMFCHMCSEKVHSRLETSQCHFKVLLTDSSQDKFFDVKRCEMHNRFLEYFCTECEEPNCPDCMLTFHPKHGSIAMKLKNQEYMADFQKAYEKLSDTLQRVHQTQKKLQKNVVFPEDAQNSEMVEAAINQHFAHLHGILQNVERRMIDKLYKQRNHFKENLNDIQQRLKTQEQQLQSAVLMATTVSEILGRVNLMDIIPVLEKMADAPCHLVQNPIVDDEKIVFCPDSKIIEIIENHCNLEIPKPSGYDLLPTETLPQDYEVESLNSKALQPIFDESFSLNSTLMHPASSCQSLCSRRSEVPALREGGTCLVKVCHIENPSNFYVRQMSYERKFKDMRRQLTTYGNSCADPPNEISVNKLYVVMQSSRDYSYRGRVTAVNSVPGAPDTYQVFDVDYGVTESQVPSSRIRDFPESLAVMPQLAINCALYDIVPIHGEWRSAARRLMHQVSKIPNTPVPMHIVKIIGNTYHVDICHQPQKDGPGSPVSVRDGLIFLGHGAFVTSQYLRRTCPQSVRRFHSEDVPLESYVEVVGSHVESPDCIYVQKTGDHFQHLTKLTYEMSNRYNSTKTKVNSVLNQVPEIGLSCAVETCQGAWYRGTIVGVPGARLVEVFLVDFGTTHTVAYEKTRKLHERFMVFATQAIKVSLADIKPCDDKWSEGARNLIRRHVNQKCARMIAFEKEESDYKVALYVGDKVESQNLAAMLISRGLAISTGPRSLGQGNLLSTTRTSPNDGKVRIRNSRTSKSKVATKETKQRKQTQPTNNAANSDPYKLLVKIIHVVSPDAIYICDTTLEDKYEQMLSELQRFYNKYRDASDKRDLQVDSPCAVYSTRDRRFCRGKIMGFKSPDEVEVFLYDQGLTENFPVSQLQALKRKFWDTPTFVWEVKLAGILPCGGSSAWPSSSCEKLKDIIAENQNSKFYVSKVVTSDGMEPNSLSVDLWVEELKVDGPLVPARVEINCVNRMLVELGLALPIKRYNEKKTTVLALELQREISYVDESILNDSVDWVEDFQKRQSISGCDETYAFVDSNCSFSSSAENSLEDSMLLCDRTLVRKASTETKLTAWLPADPIPDDKFVAICTNVGQDASVYLHSKTRNANMLRIIESTLSAEYADVEIEESDLDWKEGELCVAQYHANKKWYRGQVVRTLPKNMIEVEFIDYGNVDTCENGTLKKHQPLANIPRQSTKCVIAGLVPNSTDGKWKTSDLDALHGLMVEHECQVTVLKRKPDYLEVSLVLLTPTRRDLMSHLINNLGWYVHCRLAEPERSVDDLQSTLDTSCDVIVHGYVKDKSKCENERTMDQGEEENNNDETAKDRSIELDENSMIKIDDAVISGTANFTLSADCIESSQQEAMGKLEGDALSDIASIKGGEVITSSPLEDSFENTPKTYTRLSIPKDVEIVKAEVVLVGLTNVWLHLLDNGTSAALSKLRSLYDKITEDMQRCASQQPVLKDFAKHTPCCAKFSDGKWYRCQVLERHSTSSKSKKMMRVHFIDYGNDDCVRRDKLRTLKDEWFAVPSMALCCKLWGVTENPLVIVDAVSHAKVRNAWKVDEKPPQPVYVKIEGRPESVYDYDVQIYTDEQCTTLIYESLINDILLRDCC